MGKHDKQETEFKWEVPKDDFYKARIERLKSENKNLRSANAKMKQLDKCVEILGNNYTDKVNEKYDLETLLEDLQEKYNSAMAYIEELEQAKLNLETKVDEYESAILKVVVQI
jgi:predicted  nucleic acid-binding Zn-ribbon protein